MSELPTLVLKVTENRVAVTRAFQEGAKRQPEENSAFISLSEELVRARSFNHGKPQLAEQRMVDDSVWGK